MKIRMRVILVIISTNFMIILLSVLAGTGYVRKHIENYIEADMMVVADIADRFISAELDLLRYEAGAAAESLAAARPGDWAGVLAAEARQYSKFTGMAVLSRNAGAVVSAGENPASPVILENKFVREAFSGGKAFTSTVPAADGGAAFYLAVPVPGAEDHILALTLDGMYFSDLASEYHVWETGHIFIDDNEGYVIANIRPEWVLNRRNFIIEARDNPQFAGVASVVQKLVAGGRGIEYYSMDGISRICAYRPVSGSKEGWRLGIVAPLSESPVRNVDRGLFLIAAVGFLLNVAAAAVASDFIRRPFEETAALRAAAEASSRAKSGFLAHMSHEIRTPLNAVVGLSELALAGDGFKDGMEDKLEKIHASGMTILSIVNDILDISKIESGKFELYSARYDTPSLINDIVTLNIVRIGEKPVTFKLAVDENLPGQLYGDDLRVKQIFNNLLSNAFKYTHSGTVEWRITFERDGDSVWLVSSVRDTGIGIKPDDLKKLFSDYNQVDTEANRQAEGTGLGLAITKRLVEMMGGTISVESEYGKGTAFHVRVRQTFVSAPPVGKETAANLMGLRYTLSKRAGNTKLARVNLSYARVLIVDDIAANLDVVKGMMKAYGMAIDCVSGGPEAIEMIRAEKPRYSAVFMDHMMPGMDGIEAARIIREEIGTDYARNIPIIALTANAVVGTEEMFLSRGFQDFIPKPIDIAKLDAALRRWVRNKDLEKELFDAEEETPGAGGSGHGNYTPVSFTVKGVDTQKTLERFGGDETILIDVLHSYAANIPPLLISLEEYLSAGKLKDYAIIIHGIKGSSYGIFAEEAGRAAEELETAARAGDPGAVKAGHAVFKKIEEELLGALKDALSKIDAAADKPAAPAPSPALLQELREACETFDMDKVDRVMEQLESFRYEKGKKLIAWLRKQVNDMTFEEISGGEWPSE